MLRRIGIVSLSGDMLHEMDADLRIAKSDLQTMVRKALDIQEHQDFYLVKLQSMEELPSTHSAGDLDLTSFKKDEPILLLIVKELVERSKVKKYAELLRDASRIWGDSLCMDKLEFDPCDCEIDGCSKSRVLRCPRARLALGRDIGGMPVSKWAQDLDYDAPPTLPLRKLWYGIGTFAHRLSQVKCNKAAPEDFTDAQHACLLARASYLLQLCRHDMMLHMQTHIIEAKLESDTESAEQSEVTGNVAEDPESSPVCAVCEGT